MRCDLLALGLPSSDISEPLSGAIQCSVNSLADLAKLGWLRDRCRDLCSSVLDLRSLKLSSS